MKDLPISLILNQIVMKNTSNQPYETPWLETNSYRNCPLGIPHTNISSLPNLLKMKSLFVSFFFLMMTVQVKAQYNLLFQHTSDQVSWNTSDAIADDGQGNTWLAGHFENSIIIGPYTLTTVPSGNGSFVTTAFFGKYNSDSNSWLWLKKIALMLPQGSFNYSWIYDITLDDAGNLYLTGIYAGTVSFDGITLTSTKQGNVFTPDMFVAKYNSGGTALWAKSFGSKNGMDWGQSIQVDGSGNIYAAGAFANKIVKCGGYNIDQRDIFLVKLNNRGTSLWQKRYASNTGPCNGNNAATALDLDPAGNPHISGNFVGTVTFGTGMNITSLGKEDIFVAKINSSGVSQWVRTAGTTDYDYSHAIHVDASGGVYSGGRINLTSFITKYNSAGISQWTVDPFPGKGVNKINASGLDILVNDTRTGFKHLAASDGTLIEFDSISGYDVTGRMSIKDVENAGNGFVFNVTLQCGYNTIEDQTFTASCVNTCGVCFNFGDIGMVRNTGTPPPAFSTPFNESTSVIQGMELEIFPNPASDVINVKFPDLIKPGVLIIQDQFGRTVWTEKFESQRRTATINLDGQSFQSGIYYLICLSNGEVKTIRFVIDK